MAVGVPGNLGGWHRLATDYGTFDFSRLLTPAIKLARDGFPVTGGIPTVTPEYWDLRSSDPEWVRVYTPGSKHIEAGWILRQPDLARTLETIAVEGPSALYTGRLGEAIVSHLASLGGVLSMADLERVDVPWTEPLHVSYQGLDVHTLAPPAEAFQFLLTLAILDDTGLGDCDRNSVEHLDRVFRAVRLAGEQRICHNQAPIGTIIELLAGSSLEHLRRRHQSGEGRQGRVQQWHAITDPALVGKGEYTTSLSTADADGNMVCITQSLGSIYGSGVVVPNTGICLNNFLNWTDLDPRSRNFVGPGERMAMCLAPTISTRAGEPVLALGTPGSYGILHTQLQTMVQYLEFGLPLQQAIDAPRARLWDGNLAHVESRIDQAVIDALVACGHDVTTVEPFTRVVGGMQAIERNPVTGALTGAADSRRDGYAAAP
jgi:gamma-glutamyltranspeptidase/glutathione hydrolase